jgi:hypothetical protein
MRGFAVDDPATESYTGHPDDAYDTAAIIYLADYQK